MRILAIDPGNTQSGWLECETADVLGGLEIIHFGIAANERIVEGCEMHWPPRLAIECPRARGMPTSNEEMETLVEIGRFVALYNWQADIGSRWSFVFRGDVKLHLCGSMRAKDKNIRQALIDRFGGNRVAIGAVKCRVCKGKGWAGRGRPVCPVCNGDKWAQPPGVLHGVSSHVWPALAVACYFADNPTIRQRIVKTESEATDGR